MPKPQIKKLNLIDIVKIVLVSGALAMLLIRGATSMGYNWQWYRVSQYLLIEQAGSLRPGLLLQGLWVTLKITSMSMVLAFLIGLLTALARLSGCYVCRLIARFYLELVRNTPLLVQIFLIYFVFAPVLGIDRFSSAIIALSFFEGAYASEIFRAGIVSIHKSQWEAAFSLGLDSWKTYRLVILPQAVRRILPPLTGQAVSLIKDSALVSTIAIYDLTMQGQAIVARTYLVFEIWLTVAAIYLALTLALSATSRKLEKKMAVFNLQS